MLGGEVAWRRDFRSLDRSSDQQTLAERTPRFRGVSSGAGGLRFQHEGERPVDTRLDVQRPLDRDEPSALEGQLVRTRGDSREAEAAGIVGESRVTDDARLRE